MTKKTVWFFVWVVMLTGCGGGTSTSLNDTANSMVAAQVNELLPDNADETVSVFVALDQTGTPASGVASKLSSEQERAYRQEQFLKTLQEHAKPTLKAVDGVSTCSSSALATRINDAHSPVSGSAVRIDLNACELGLLAKIKGVAGVHADIPMSTQGQISSGALTNTINAVKQSFNGINAQPSINGSKTDGSGQVIAILDTGVEERHPALGSSKVLQGACFSTGSNGGNSLCTNHQSSNKLSLTAGRSCAETWVGGRASAIAAGCGHGTAMAAAAAFSYVSSDKVTINAIAPAAQILPIQVFNQNGMSLSANGGDLLAALEWLASEAQRRRKNDLAPIVSVNLSLGGGSYTNSCDNEFVASLFKNAFAKLRTEGVLPIVATGNAGLKNAISFPACVSNSVSVSAAQLGYGNLANYANINNQTRLIAIGGDVNGRYALPVLCPSEGIFDCWQALAGTSPATAFVSGGVAALYSAKPTATLAEIESALTSNTNSATALTLTAGNPVVNRPALRLTSSTYRLLNLQEPNPVAEMVSAPAPLPAPRPTPAPAPPAVAVQQVQICLFSNTNYTGSKSCTMQDYGGSGVGRNIFYSFFGRVGSVRISTTNAVPLSGVASVTLYNAVSPRGTSSGTIDSSSLNTTRLTGPNNPIIRLVQIKTSKP